MEFRILGPLEVWDGERVLTLGGVKQRALLAILLINANKVVTPARLIELLWDGQPPVAAANSIQVYVSHLRRTLEPKRKPGAPWQVLVHLPQGYKVQVQPAQVDALHFERLVREAGCERADGGRQRAADRLRAALALWRGPALAEFASQRFALAEALRLEELRLRAFEERIDLDLDLGRHAEIVSELRGLVAEHPLRERLCGQLMLALYRSGQQAHASDVYHRTRARLLDELGMEPSPLLERLFRDILQQAGYLERRAGEPAHHNLPHLLTTFVGRSADLAQLTNRLAVVRLLTLTGPGGIGKTRLAIEVAGRVLYLFPDGAWLIDLAPISDPDLIPQAVAAELQLQEQRGRPLTDTIAAYLRDRRALLVLDNCERVLDASADFTFAILSRCSAVKVIATSRERLGMAGEQVWQVAPMTMPDTWATVSELPTFEAIQLFLDRAMLVNSDFRLGDSDGQALVQICRHLDGIPLALELAAARMASYSPSEIAARLDDRFGLLTTRDRDRPARHQTLQAALEWSHHLLDAPEQVLFRRLGVFSGSFDLEAAHAVCTTAEDQPKVEELLTRLVDKSLVLGDAVVDRTRFRMLETMREFARTRMRATGESHRLGRKHAQHFLKLVNAHAAMLRSVGASQHLAELDRNIDNIRAALEWASGNDHRLLEQLVAGLLSYWTSRCLFREALVWFSLALGDPNGDPYLRPRLLASAGWLELASGKLELGLEHSRQALAVAEAMEDDRAEVRALNNLSQAVGSMGDLRGAFTLLRRASALAEKFQDQHLPGSSFQDQQLLAASLGNLGGIQVILGELESARANLQRGMELARTAGDYFADALGGCFQSEIDLEDGNLSRAEDLARRGLEMAIAIDHRFLMLRALGQLAAVAAAKGLPARALQLAAAVDSVRAASGVGGFEKVDFWFGPGWSIRLQTVRDHLGADRASFVWDEGSRLSVYEAAAIALADHRLGAAPMATSKAYTT